MLVHGYLATPDLMRPLQRRLRNEGHDVYRVPELANLVTGDVRVHAVELDAAVQRVKRSTGCDRVNVVGASQGGIIALWWAMQGGWGDVGRLVALGTPFRGSPAARWGRPLVGWMSKGIYQLVPGSELLTQLAQGKLERPVISVSMQDDRVCPPESTQLPGMRSVVLPGGFGPLTHQLMMIDKRVAAAAHEALVC